MENNIFALKGNIIYAKDSKELCINEQSYLVCENGKVYGIYSKLPEDMKDIPCLLYTSSLSSLFQERMR